MSLVVRNRQRSFAINIDRLRSCAACMRHAAGVSDYDLTIRLTTNPIISRLNGQLRQQHRATDVLSIAPQRSFPPLPPSPLAPGVLLLGEVVISVEYVQKHGSDLGVQLMQRLERLVAHSICHLLGYDHEHDDDYERMEAKEEQLMAAWDQEKKQREAEAASKPKRKRRTKAELLASSQQTNIPAPSSSPSPSPASAPDPI